MAFVVSEKFKIGYVCLSGKHDVFLVGNVRLVHQPLTSAISCKGANNSAGKRSSLQSHDNVSVIRKKTKSRHALVESSRGKGVAKDR